MSTRCLATLVAAALLAACSGKSGPAGANGTSTGTLAGLVTDAGGTPIAGVTISLQPGDFTATTGADGAYTKALPIGVYSASADKTGFVSDANPAISVVAGIVSSWDVTLQSEAPPAVIASAGPNRFQTGFGASVQLDATGSSAPSGGALAYAWSQVSGPAVELSDPAVARPTFTTHTLEALEAAQVFTAPSRLHVVGFSESDLARLGYVFEVTVTDGVTSAAARVSVRPVVGQPGMTNVAADVLAVLGAQAGQGTYAWTCVEHAAGGDAPCAAGVLTDAATRTPKFRTTVEGAYTVTEAQATSPLDINVASYRGVRPIDGVRTCVSCHSVDVASLSIAGGRTLTAKYPHWVQSKHATYFRRAIDGELIPGYGAACIRCHTIGYNPDARNGGFAQAAAAEGWNFPAQLVPGNWDNLSPKLQALASVGCESCHGPGSRHDELQTAATIVRSFTANDCTQCHSTEPYENQGLQWANAKHSQFVPGFDSSLYPVAQQGVCASCHSSQGFVAWQRTGSDAVTPSPVDVTEPQTCSACHDPHGEARGPDGQPTPKMVRKFDVVATGVPGVAARGVGPAALCITCHNTRVTYSVVTQYAPHGGAQSDVTLGKSAQQFGQGAYPTSAHAAVTKLCVGCHMAPTPPLGSTGHNLVGGHTFAVRAGTLLNLTACTGCHDGLTTFDRLAYGDYDGNGVVEGLQTEVGGLQALLQGALDEQAAALWPTETAAAAGATLPRVMSRNGTLRVLKAWQLGVSDPNCDPTANIQWAETCFAFPIGGIPQATAAEQNLLAAAWNATLVTNDRSAGVHNGAFVVSVLQRSYQAVTGAPVPNATPR